MAPNAKINLKDKVEDGEMDLSMCDLQEVPIKDIATYKKVYSLDLSNNHLVNLTKSFPTLTNLTKLDLSKNKLKSLPENFGNLVKLRHLDLYKNDLQHLPISFSDLKNLRWLDLKDNPLVPGIKEEAGQCLDSKQCMSCALNIVAFYSALKVKIQEERDNREKQRQKDKQANELAAQKAKQIEKKNKKKEKVKNNEGKVSVKPEVVPEVKKSSEKKPKHVKKSGGKLRSFVFMCVLFWFLCGVLFILTSMNYPHTKFIQEGIVKYWGMCLERSPPALKEFGNKTGGIIGNFHQELGKIIFDLHLHDNALNYIGKIKEYYKFVLNEKK